MRDQMAFSKARQVAEAASMRLRWMASSRFLYPKIVVMTQERLCPDYFGRNGLPARVEMRMQSWDCHVQKSATARLTLDYGQLKT